MSYLTCIICILIVGISKLQKKSISDPPVLFALIWGVICALSHLQLFNLEKPDSSIYLFILIGVLSFWFGSASAFNIKTKLTIGDTNSGKRQIRGGIFGILTVAFFALMFIPTFRAMMLLVSGYSLYTIRYVMLKDIFGEGVIAILLNYFCEPYLVFMIVYSVANLFSADRKIRITVITIIGIILMTIDRGGRFFILYYVGALAVGYLIYRKQITSNLEKKTLRKVRFLIAVGAIGIIAVSIIRNSDIGKTMYVYSTGGLNFFDHLQTEFSETDYTLGALTLSGYLRPIFVVFRKIGLGELPAFVENAEEIFLFVDEPYFLAQGTVFNSFTTCFFAPYLDGGIPGIIIVFFVLGYMSEKAYKNIELDNSFRVTIYLLTALIILFSFFRLLITHYSFALSFVYLLICFGRMNGEQSDE